MMQLTALTRQFKQILLMSMPIQIKAVHYINYKNIMMQLIAMTRQFKQILIMPMPIQIKAIQIDPTYAMAYNNKGLSLECLKKYDQALKNYDQSIMINKINAQAYKLKGSLLTQQKKFLQAIKVYEQAIQNCQTDQNEFKKLIQEIKNKK
ncbi:unnamed protein product [Paramecium sonneborni]|uniref:Tetratricopeptide repeat protein n=1 Tax=Paramecium sonneborni TaxID=65129 RepID=A0A8S1Q2K7_9CILI|nr:unnamed protein product [Paramecium sonneborni]